MLDSNLILKKIIKDHKHLDSFLIEKALSFCIKHHGGQFRSSGEPFYYHPIEVACILSDMNLDTESIVTALLHDIVEDTHITLKDIEKDFGLTISKLVDGLTKISKVTLEPEKVKQAENFRKLVIAMSQDIRVLLVKLADRLHNMRTIFFRPEHKRRRIALETLEIYACLAERIGVHKIKNELQDISFNVLYPEIYKIIIGQLNSIALNRKNLIVQIIEKLQEILRKYEINAQISGREKTPYSIWMKMINKNMSFDQLSDVIGFRILVTTNQECYQALGVLHSHYQMVAGRFHDFISIPKDNGYQSLHTVIIGPQSQKIEVQIRTHQMHSVAEFGVCSHWSYKQKYKGNDGSNYKWMQELLSILNETASTEDFLKYAKLSIYDNQIFCFTPKGDLISLPSNAKGLDFAYSLHSDIGNHCVGVKVNGKLVSLRSELSNGDLVEVITSKSQHPSPSWYDIVVSGKAKSAIKKYFAKSLQNDKTKLGQSLIESAFKSIGVDNIQKTILSLANEISKPLLDLYYDVAIGKIKCSTLIEIVQNKRQKTTSFLNTKSQISNLNKYPISGIAAGVPVYFAKCCNPIPYDNIIGIVATGKWVSIHMQNCKIALSQDENIKLPYLKWNDSAADSNKYVTKLLVITNGEYKMINSISNIITQKKINIINLSVNKIDQFFFEIIYELQLENTESINKLKNFLISEKFVYFVERYNG